MKFVKTDGLEIEYSSEFNVVEKISPFIEIITKKPLTDFSIVTNEEKSISFENIFQLQVNVNNAGSVSFLFEKGTLNKEEIVEKISALRELPSKTESDIENKIKSLFEIVLPYSPLASIFNQNGKFKLSPSTVEVLSAEVLSFYVNPSSGSADSKRSPNAFGGITKEKQGFENPFKVIAKDKFHFLFALVSTFLIGFTVSIGVYDCYLGKMILIFFFICSLSGIVLNAFIYYDTFKSHYFNEMYTILTIVANIVGIALSFGGYALFLHLTPDKLLKNPNIIMIVAIVIGATIISVSGSYLIRFINKIRKH